jgi:hypothetical protein
LALAAAVARITSAAADAAASRNAAAVRLPTSVSSSSSSSAESEANVERVGRPALAEETEAAARSDCGGGDDGSTAFAFGDELLNGLASQASDHAGASARACCAVAAATLSKLVGLPHGTSVPRSAGDGGGGCADVGRFLRRLRGGGVGGGGAGGAALGGGADGGLPNIHSTVGSIVGMETVGTSWLTDDAHMSAARAVSSVV